MIFQHAHRDFALIFRFPKPHTISYAFLSAFYSSILSAKKISFIYAGFRDTYAEIAHDVHYPFFGRTIPLAGKRLLFRDSLDIIL